MNGPFIDINETFPITLKVKFIFDGDGHCTGVDVLSNDAEGDGIQTIVCDTTGRDFSRMSEIMEAATVINHLSKRPMLRRKILFRQVILTFFQSWNLPDDSGGIAEINSTWVGKLHDSICRALAWKWLKVTGGRSAPDTYREPPLG